MTHTLLKKGDSLGIVAPCSLFSREKFDLAIEYIKSIGLKPVVGPNVFSRDFIFSGTVKERVQSLRFMLNRDDLKAIWCVRGGAGSYAVAQEMAKDKKPKTSKIILGMSDVTALHLLFYQKWGWPVLHAPLFDRLSVSPQSEKKVIENTLFESDFRLKVSSGLKSFSKSGQTVAPMVGGNLALLAASLGSAWEVQTKGKILFIEDIGERAYRIDRMLTQLKSAGKLKDLKGLIVGDFTDCKEADGRELWKTVLKRHFENAKYPCLMGFKSGHGDLRLTIPFGLKVKIQAGSKNTFEVMEGIGRAP